MTPRTEMQPEHKMILEIVDALGAVTGESATPREVLDGLTTEDRSTLDSAYVRAPLDSIERILRYLAKRGHLSEESTDGQVRYSYVGELDSDPPSNRRVAQRLISDCFHENGRCALRSGDIKEYLPMADYASHLTWKDVQGAIASLIKTEDIQDLGLRPGGGHRGRRVFAPLGEEVEGESAPTWVGHVLEMFWDVWRCRLREAEESGRRPRPPATGDIREAVRNSGKFIDRLDNPQLLVNAVRGLSERTDPPIRKVRRPGERTLLWAPYGVDDEELDLGGAFSADTERVVEAVHRAESKFARPVILDEVQDEIDRDPALRPAGKSPVRNILHDLAKTTVQGSEERMRRARQRVWSVGTVGGRTYFVTHDPEDGRWFTAALELQRHWDALEVSTEIGLISECPYPSLRIGRALELQSRIDPLLDELTTISGSVDPSAPAGGIIETVNEELVAALDDIAPIVTHGADELPEEVSLDLQGFTPREMVELFEPHYPSARKLEDPSQIVPLLDRAVWRIPNPDHSTRFDTDPDAAAEYLFEQTDALVYMANRWGGVEAIHQANLASFALGRLRDVRFVLPLFESDDQEARFVGVACLAFLQDQETLDLLQRVRDGDPVEGLRESAVWARAFIEADSLESSRSD